MYIYIYIYTYVCDRGRSEADHHSGHQHGQGARGRGQRAEDEERHEGEVGRGGAVLVIHQRLLLQDALPHVDVSRRHEAAPLLRDGPDFAEHLGRSSVAAKSPQLLQPAADASVVRKEPSRPAACGQRPAPDAGPPAPAHPPAPCSSRRSEGRVFRPLSSPGALAHEVGCSHTRARDAWPWSRRPHTCMYARAHIKRTHMCLEMCACSIHDRNKVVANDYGMTYS